MKHETADGNTFDAMGLFGLALGLSAPWRVERVEFVGEPEELHLHLVAGTEVPLACGQCGVVGPVYDLSAERVWRHLNFFQYRSPNRMSFQ